MQPIRPFLKCVDYWPGQIPAEKLAVYKKLIADKIIRGHHVVYNRATGSTTVEYSATVPHEWVMDALKSAVREENAEQLSLTLPDPTEGQQP